MKKYEVKNEINEISYDGKKSIKYVGKSELKSIEKKERYKKVK